jgi:hypothetical protein
MNDSALYKLDLQAGEQVVWSNVQSGDVLIGKPPPKKSLVGGFLWAIIVVAWCLYLVITGNRYEAIAVVLFVLVMFFLTAERLGKFYAWLPRLSPTETHAHLSCVITNHRVMLFDLPGETPVSLPRASLDRVWQDFAEGSQALLFRHSATRDTHAFISTIDFGPALRALDMKRTTP